MRNNLKIERYINTEIKVGDKVRFVDGSALYCITYPEKEFSIINSYKEVFGSTRIMEDLYFTVEETGVEDYINTFEICNTAYLQDAVVSLDGVQFRTCSKFITKEPKGSEEVIFIDYLDLV